MVLELWVTCYEAATLAYGNTAIHSLELMNKASEKEVYMRILHLDAVTGASAKARTVIGQQLVA